MVSNLNDGHVSEQTATTYVGCTDSAYTRVHVVSLEKKQYNICFISGEI